MLILWRQLKETIVIGDEIRITVAEIGRRDVSLRIEAPQDVRIMREEARRGRKEKEPGEREGAPPEE